MTEPTDERGIADAPDIESVFAITTGSEPRHPSKQDGVVCMECEQQDRIETETRRVGLTTVGRHTCTRCETHGATVVEDQVSAEGRLLWTAGEVRTVNMVLSDNADYRGSQ